MRLFTVLGVLLFAALLCFPQVASADDYISDASIRATIDFFATIDKAAPEVAPVAVHTATNPQTAIYQLSQNALLAKHHGGAGRRSGECSASGGRRGQGVIRGLLSRVRRGGC